MIGQVVKVHSDKYFVKTNNITYQFVARGKLKFNLEKIKVGDFVEVENGAIKKILDRKNSFIRPSVSNIDSILIILSQTPKPDLLLTDILLANAINQGIEVVFAINKTDLGDEVFDEIKNYYKDIGAKFFKVSALNKVGIEELKDYLKGRLTVLAGQSAVGKTSIINALFDLDLKTGELSDKIMRGKHTTTHSEIFEFGDIKIIDSPGFYALDSCVKLEELPDCYPEYAERKQFCKFRECTHISEPDCQVKKDVENGVLSKERYDRYVEIYNQLKMRRKLYEKY